MNKCSKFLIVLNLFYAGMSLGEVPKKIQRPKRISAQVVDLGKVQTIYMVPGMATLVEVPTDVSGIRLGNPDFVNYFRPDHPKNEVTLVLKEGLMKPTNLFILSGKKKYIFDIIPSADVHQDSLSIIGAFGGAELEAQHAELVDSSEEPYKPIEWNPKLLQKL